MFLSSRARQRERRFLCIASLVIGVCFVGASLQTVGDFVSLQRARNDNVVITISKLPPVWPTAEHDGKPDPTWYCGAYQQHASLLAEGKDVPITDLYLTKWDRDGYNVFGKDPSDHSHTIPWEIPIIMARYGVFVEMHYRSAFGLLPLALQSLEHGHPLIVQIYATRGHHGLHWIGVWGYDARSRSFMVYDSQYSTKRGDVGNTKYSVELLQSRLPWSILMAAEVYI